MMRGSDTCWFSSGIYFGDNVAECKVKARYGRATPYIVKCKVFLGRAVLLDTGKTKKIGKQKVTHTSLRNHYKEIKGCNSILAYNIKSGNEYVVYNHAYCTILSIKSEDGSDVVYSKPPGSSKNDTILSAARKSMNNKSMRMCPKGNTLTRFDTPHEYFVCDGCDKGTLPKGTTMYGCRSCNYDLCEKCIYL
jgi:hypothetical protein